MSCCPVSVCYTGAHFVTFTPRNYVLLSPDTSIDIGSLQSENVVILTQFLAKFTENGYFSIYLIDLQLHG